VIGSLSPRDAVLSANKRVDDGNVKGYYVQKIGEQERILNYSVPKRNTLSIIAEVANKKASIPSPNSYNLVVKNDWNVKSSRNTSDNLMSREKRVSEAALIEIKNQKPETSSPSPLHYSPDKNKIMSKGSFGIGGTGLLMRD